MLIDTHCHVNFPTQFPDPAVAIASANEGGIKQLIAIGVDLESSLKAVELAEKFDAIFAVVGFHPTSTANFKLAWLNPLKDVANHPKVVAIGEIGLDYHWDTSSPIDQERALLAQLDWAEELGKPVVFHCRDAYDAHLALLERRSIKVPFIFHCFAGDGRHAERAVALGSYFGVDGPITYKNADELRATIAKIPRERIVVETDAPYLPPVPYRGKPNKPEYLRFVAEKLAEIWHVSREEATRITTENAQTFFSLPKLAAE